MSYRRLLTVLGFGLLLAAATAQAAKPKADAPPTVDIPYTRFVLQNGLTVIVHEDHKAPIVAVNVWYHVGSKNEPAGRSGFAHLYEHLMFTGTQHAPDGFDQLLASIGGTDNNGTTNNDRTDYFENVPKNALDTALWMESERMGFLLPVLDQKKLDTQRGVVQNEKRQDENAPYGKVELNIAEATYPAAHPYHHTVIGSMEDLNAASLADVQEWFKTFYGPNNAVLSIAGDVDTDEVKQKVQQYFGAIPPTPPVAHVKEWVAKMSGTQREVLQDRVPASRVYMVWNTPGATSPEADYLELLTNVLARGKVSRLYKRLVYDDQVATDVEAYVDEREIGSQFTLIATARPDKPGALAKVESDIQDELAKFLKSGPRTEVLARSNSAEYADYVLVIESIGGFGGI
jgi:zinc protease